MPRGKDSFPQYVSPSDARQCCLCGSSLMRSAEPMRVRQGGCNMALIIGLVSITVIWVVVIYGSIYVNKNVQ